MLANRSTLKKSALLSIRGLAVTPRRNNVVKNW
jgi:hypothetical protein